MWTFCLILDRALGWCSYLRAMAKDGWYRLYHWVGLLRHRSYQVWHSSQSRLLNLNWPWIWSRSSEVPCRCLHHLVQHCLHHDKLNSYSSRHHFGQVSKLIYKQLQSLPDDHWLLCVGYPRLPAEFHWALALWSFKLCKCCYSSYRYCDL